MRISGDWTLRVGHEYPGCELFATSWVAEKLAKVVRDVAEVVGGAGPEARESCLFCGRAWEAAEELGHEEWCQWPTLYDAYRTSIKLAGWLAGRPSSYSEEATHAAFQQGEAAMLRHFTVTLGVSAP